MQRSDSLYVDGSWRAASNGGVKDYFDVKYTNMVLM